MEASDEKNEGMPIMLKDPVLLKVVRLRKKHSYLVPHEDKKRVKLLKIEGENKNIPKSTEWKVIWSGEPGICSFVSIYGSALTNRALLISRACQEPWPVLDGAADWYLDIVNHSNDSKAFHALIRPGHRVSFFYDTSLEVFMGVIGICTPADFMFSSSLGWTIEVVASSILDAQQFNGMFQLPNKVTYKYVNQGIVVSNSQNVKGEYSNSGYNKNGSGTQSSGACVGKYMN